jgi:hypothetical protein
LLFRTVAAAHFSQALVMMRPGAGGSSRDRALCGALLACLWSAASGAAAPTRDATSAALCLAELASAAGRGAGDMLLQRIQGLLKVRRGGDPA